MSHYKIHILYEYGLDLRPYSSAYIRLLRPLTHPVFHDDLEITSGLVYEGQKVDAVILDRFWRPAFPLAKVKQLLADVRSTGAKLIYTLDDNFFELANEKNKQGPGEELLQTLRFVIRQANGIVVTTPMLKEVVTESNSNVVIIPNVLDDRLLDGRRLPWGAYHFSLRQQLHRLRNVALRNSHFLERKKKIIGYMGTFTHDNDLMMILPALQEVTARYADQVELHILGVTGRSATLAALQGIPLRVINLSPEMAAYPNFLTWFSRCIQWSVAVAPLCDTAFNRSKSDIKFLDYSATGTAGIFSHVPAYASTVRHLETGWLVENTTEAWIEALDTLLSNRRLRYKLARNAARYLYRERIVPRYAPQWLDALRKFIG
ncbi:MAG: hypothetical protein JXA33_02070 [Anaerolineae bacterium]|nr:hypothetical protein [Anaerolineae bacterium]